MRTKGPLMFIRCLTPTCHWSGTEMSVESHDECWSCPRCGMDESGLSVISYDLEFPVRIPSPRAKS